MVNEQLINFLPKRELLVLNDMVDGFKRGMVEYQAAMNLPDRQIKITKTTPEYSTIELVNFNDNDVMLFGYFFYRTMMNTAAILATPTAN